MTDIECIFKNRDCGLCGDCVVKSTRDLCTDFRAFCSLSVGKLRMVPKFLIV